MHFLAPALILAVCDLSGIFAEKTGWEQPAEAFVAAHRAEGFRFADQERNAVLCLERGGAVWNALEVWEARVDYGATGATRVEMSLYNRGDAARGEALPSAALNDLLGRIAAAAEPGGRLPPRPERRKLPSGGYRFTTRFTRGPNDVELVWGVDSVKAKEQTADYVRVTLTPKGAAKRNAPAGDAKARARAHVRENAAGDVWIDAVPMVDQGRKGYCAAAVSERVLRYYGETLDEHQVAQLSGTTAQGGTSVSEMLEAVRAIGSKYHLGFQSVVAMAGGLKEINRDLEAYNKMAKKMRKPEISLDACREGDTLAVPRLREQMLPAVVLAARVKDSRFKRFLSGIKAGVDQGVPVFWGVTLGMFPEPEIPQARGGHMRLVIGYNAKTHEILYTDSWGAGHELKRMREDRAFAITHDAFLLRPL